MAHADQFSPGSSLGILSWFFGQVVLRKDPEVDTQQIHVIGAGLGRTGTASLKIALGMLGYKTYHMKEVMENSHAWAWNQYVDTGNVTSLMEVVGKAGYNATLDFPACLVYRKLLAANPNAKVILSVRDSPEAWAKSALATIFGNNRVPGPVFGRAPYMHFSYFRDLARLDSWMRNATVGDAVELESAAAFYTEWNARVLEQVPAKQLLVFNAKQGWPPLCSFLGVEQAKCAALAAFPHVNDTRALQAVFNIVNALADYWFWISRFATLSVAILVRLAFRCCCKK